MSKPMGKIDLAKFREANRDQRERARKGPEGHTITTRAVIRLIEDQLKEARVGDYTILCDEAVSRRGGGKAPPPLGYFVAAVGFWMFSQLTRYASELDVQIDDAEMDIRMSYDTRGKQGLAEVSPACQGVNYVFKVQSPAPPEKVKQLLQMIEKGCHTINSLRQPVPVSGRLIHNKQEIGL